MVREDEDSGRLEAEVQKDISLAALKLEPGWGDAVKNAGIGRTSRLKLAKSERRGMEDRRKEVEPVLDERVSKERETCNPIHGMRCVMMVYFSMRERNMQEDLATPS